MIFIANNSLRRHSKKHKFFAPVLALLFLTLLAGCSESPTAVNYHGCLDASYSLWTNDHDYTLRSVHGYMETAQWNYMGYGGSIDRQFITAKFCDGNTGALAENLQVNGHQLYGDTSLYTSVDRI